MKSIILNVVLLSVLVSCKAQDSALDLIDTKDVQINSIELFKLSIEEEKTQLGKPDSVIQNYDPIVDESPFYEFYYENSIISFQNDKVVDFKILDDSYEVIGLRPGDKESKVKKLFSSSYEKKYTPTDAKYQVVPISLSSDGQITDSYIHVLIEDEKVINIEYWENP